MEFGSSPPLRSCAPAPKETSIRTQLRRLEVSSAVKGVLPPPLLRLVLAYDAPVEWQQAADVALPSIRSWVKVVSALQPRKIFLVPTELWASSESIRVVSFDGELLGCVRIPPSIRWVSSAMATADGGHLYLVGAASGHAEAGALGMLAPAESVILRCDFARGGWEHVGNMQPFRSRALLRPCLSPSGARLCVLVGAETDDEFDDVTSENTAPLELMLCETKRSQWSRIPQLCSQGWAPHSAFAFSPDGSALYAVDYQPMRRGRGSCRTGGEGGGARAARFDFALGRWTELAPMRAHIKNAVIAVSQGGAKVFVLGHHRYSNTHTHVVASAYDSHTNSWKSLPHLNNLTPHTCLAAEAQRRVAAGVDSSGRLVVAMSELSRAQLWRPRAEGRAVLGMRALAWG